MMFTPPPPQKKKKNYTRSYSGPGILKKTKETEVIIYPQ